MTLTIGTFLGGLGLFLLAVSMITDGVKLAAGDALREILARSTRTRWRGVASGVLVTSVVQSSSAVTVATIGFVNAGLLTLVQSLGIVYGANIGTTVTGWLVAALGFQINVETFALPLIGIGMLARLAGPSRRIGALGEALAGFGLFFIGVDVLRNAFAELSASLDISTLAPVTGIGILLYVGFGFLITLVTQSSSAAIAITLTAATGGVLAFDAAAAMVIGANVGTTSTAVLAGIGATPNAKRVAAAHVMFNTVTGAVALLLLPVLLKVVDITGSALGLATIPAVTLALFHTTFNVLGVLLMWPLTGRLSTFLLNRFTTSAEMLSRPRHLDSNVMVTPFIAVDALRLELERMAAMAREQASEAVRPPTTTRKATEKAQALTSLTDTVEGYVTSLQRQRLSQELAEQLPLALRINNYLEEVAQLSQELVLHDSDITAITVGTIAAPIVNFRAHAEDVLRACDPEGEQFDLEQLRASYQDLQHEWHDLKSTLLNAASQGQIPMARLNDALDRLRACLRIAERGTKVAERSMQLKADSTGTDADPGTVQNAEATAGGPIVESVTGPEKSAGL